MAEEEAVRVLGFLPSPFALRVEWALNFKGINYEYKDEDIHNKSPELLKYNPVHKKIPILLHGSKPVVESLVIMEYIEETWPQSPILSKDPYERAMSRFWAKYGEDKCIPALFGFFTKQGEEELVESLKTLEKGLNGKKFFAGETIGFTDIALGWIPVWLKISQEILGENLINEQTHPLFYAWSRDFLDHPVIKEKLPPYDMLLAQCQAVHDRLLASSKP
ncbi:glutathione transferase GST 23 [Amborella trichopoda]|uniref:glutathione transferase n=1 Tax=Amborella trichopoda TaxID=13333 RepID=W1NQ43_AMBTC|nr:glutathione transferase GST 23 [Amborella trichopoda]ERM97230.1 hypothetical protein AMTR_s00119p00077600 [Amborella trichopoda]|eukprot:XP_006829814.1 glutathione transferase GST 23 [Amborella trichopoda]